MDDVSVYYPPSDAAISGSIETPIVTGAREALMRDLTGETKYAHAVVHGDYTSNLLEPQLNLPKLELFDSMEAEARDPLTGYGDQSSDAIIESILNPKGGIANRVAETVQKIDDITDDATADAASDASGRATADAPTEAAANGTKSRSVDAKRGDTVWAIAERELRERNGGAKPSNKEILEMVHAIAKENNMDDPNILMVGQTVKLPPRDELQAF